MQNFKVFKQNLRKICKIFSFIKIDFSFLFIFLIAIIIEEVRLYFYFVLFLLLHELSHFLVAKKLGYMAGKIRLGFFGARLEGLDDFSIADEIKVVLAGPLFNLVVIIFCYLCYWFNPESYEYLSEIQLANYGIFFFNMLPIFPLDMGRLVLSIANIRLSRTDALKVVKIISFIFILIMFSCFVISCFFEFNFMLGLASINLMALLLSRAKDTAYRRNIFIEHKFSRLGRGLIQRTIFVKHTTEPYKLFRFIDDYHFITFNLVDENFKIIKTMTEIDLFKEFYGA